MFASRIATGGPNVAADAPMRKLCGVWPVALALSCTPGHAQMFNGFAGDVAIGNVVRNSTAPIFRPSIEGREHRAMVNTMDRSGGFAFDLNSDAARAAPRQYLDRLRKVDPVAADALDSQMRAHDFGQVFTNLVGPYGLQRSNAADTLTAFMVLGWLIATGSPDPHRAAVQAARSAISRGMSSEPKFANGSIRAALGEELVITCVTLHAGWQSARREGKLQQYSDGVAAMFLKQGTDLRALQLTDRGFVAR